MRQIFSLVALAITLLTASAQGVTLTAEQAADLAVKNSEEMTAAVNAVEQADINKKIAHTAYLPKLAGSLTGAWMPDSKYDDVGIRLQMRGMYMAGINITQPIYVGGKIVAANRQAEIGRTAARQQQRLTDINLRARALTSYWTYVAVLAKVEMMKSYRAVVDTAYNQTLAALEAGMATRNELLRIEARRSQVVYQQEQVANGADLCRMALCNAVGLPSDTPVTPADTEISAEVPADLSDYNLDDRPEMQLLKADIDVKEQQVKIVRADFLPQLGLQAGWSAFGNLRVKWMQPLPDGSYMPLSETINSNGFNVMLSLQVPIFHWGEGIKKVKSAKIDVQNARLNLEGKTRQLDLQVRQTITNVRTGLELLKSAHTAVNTAEAALTSTATSYSLGMAKITDLLDAQAGWHTARADLIEAQTQLRISVIDYLAATARL